MAKKQAQKSKATKKVSKTQQAVNKLYNSETKADAKAYKSALNSPQNDAEYNKPSAARKKNNKAFGITNPTDRIASTPTAKVYNVNNHYKQAISGVFKNANTMVKGQKAVNQKNAAETIRAAVDAGNDANHQNDVRYNQAKHVVANDSATTKNKLSVNHAQNLNKITTNTTANVSSAEATKDKANANSLEKYYNFKGTTLKNMKLNRISKTQEQKNNDKSLAAAYKQTRISASQARKKRNYAHKETMRSIATNKYDTIAKNKYQDLASVDKAIKELKGKKGVKYKIDKLTSLYNIRASLVDAGTSTRRSGGSGRRSGGGRGRSGTIIAVTAVGLVEITADTRLSVMPVTVVILLTIITERARRKSLKVSICIVRPSFVTIALARALIRLRAEMPPNVNMHVVMAAVSRKALAFLRKRRTGTRRILTTTVRSGQF